MAEKTARRLRLALAIAGGATLGLATPPVDLYPAAWVGQAALAYVLFEQHAREGAPSSWRRWLASALTGWLFGTAANVVVLRFVPTTIVRFTPLPLPVGLLALLLLGMAEGLRWLAVAVVTRQLMLRRVPGFLAFGIGAWISTFVPVVFPWSVAGGISPMTRLMQLADVIGERGTSALFAISAALLAEAVRAALARGRRLSVQYTLFGAAVPALLAVFGTLRMHQVEAARAAAPHARVALVQPSTQARERWDPNEAVSILRRLTMLTTAAEQRGTDLVIWPEAAYPYVVSATAQNDLAGSWAVLQPGVRGPVLTGMLMQSRGAAYNSAATVHGGHIDPPYHKMHLLAFGESVPLADTFPALKKAFVRGTGLAPGTQQVLQHVGPIRAAVLNCFEDILPEAGREAAGVDPNVLVNVTNDAWFAGTQESELHLRLAAMRAIELRRDFVRAVNLGPTSWVDAAGVVRGRYDLDVAGSLPAQPALLEGRTIYARFGDWAGALVLALLSAAVWAGTKGKRRTE